MPKLKLDNQTIDVPEGATVLDAAKELGVEIPTLCYLEGFEAGASCMVCAVKLKHNGQFIPACGSRVVDGMEVECDSSDVRDARRTALELLFSDHLGDCLSPCQRICPAHLRIPAVLAHLREDEPGKAAAAIRSDLALPGVLCRVCHRPCESGCRRGVHDEPVAIADLVVHAIDTETGAGGARVLPAPPERDSRVAVIGAGFTGLSAAWFLRRIGYPCVVIEAEDQPAGTIRGEFPDLSPGALDVEIGLLERSGVEFRTGVRVADAEALNRIAEEFDAVLIAAGSEAAEAFGLASEAGRLTADKETMMSSRDGVFVAGRAVRPAGKPVQAVADGKAAATCIDQFLTGKPVRRPPKPFSIFMGKVDGGEMGDFLVESEAGHRASAIDIERAIEESNRCVRCNCAKADTCKLRQLALDYDVNTKRYNTGERLRYSRNIEHPLVRFEPAKCIRCGNCIKVAGAHREALGLTFIGRGFDVHVGVPFHESMSDGLVEAARQAVEACPTGALTLRDEAG